MNRYLVDPANILRTVDIVFQVMAKAGHRYGGLFPAIAERQVGNVLMDFPLPAPIPGQRNSDRSVRGCNLEHDIGLLRTLDGLDQALDRPRYQLQRRAYLETFAKECAAISPTGLLPWGEHSFWNLQHWTIGNSYLLQYGEQPLDAGLPTHQQMFLQPFENWKLMHEFNPELLPRFVDGLEWHWDDEEHTSFNRHAPITQFIRAYQAKRGARMSGKSLESQMGGSDFPGIAGLFIHDYACAISLTGQSKWKQPLLDFSNSWWERKHESGILPKSGGKGPLNWNGLSLGMTVGHANGTLEAAKVLRGVEDELADLLQERGESYIKAVLNIEQPELEKGFYVTSFNPDGSPFSKSQPWAGNRGQACCATEILKVMRAAALAGDNRGEETGLRAAESYLDSFIPRNTIVRAGDPAAVIALCTEAYRLGRDEKFLTAALTHATDAMELYFDSPLPRMATGRNHYESQQGSSDLVHSLARLYLIAEGKECLGGLADPMK